MIKTWTISLVVAWVIVLAMGVVLVRRALIPAPTVGGDPQAAYANGRADAERDVANGKLVVMTFGFPPPSVLVQRSNLWNQYRIELRPVAGCGVTDVVAASVRGYNEVSEAEIKRRFGADVLDRAATEAALE